MHICEHARRTPDRPAVLMADTGDALSYRELEARSNQSAHVLRDLGLKRGDVIATLFENGPEVFILGWAGQRTGLYQTAISNKLSAADIAYILQDCGARLLIASDGLAELARSATESLENLACYLWSQRAPGFASWAELTASAPDVPVADESSGSDLLYSSGTTGRPKGVCPPLPTGPITDPTPLTSMGTALYGMNNESVYLSTSPLYHAAPLRWSLTVQKLGGTVVVMQKFDAEGALRLIDQHRITHATFVPTHFVRMLKLPDAVRQRYTVSSMKAAIHAAAPCPVPIKHAMIDWFGPVIFEYYAGTESCGITALDSREWLEKPGSVGKAVLGKVHIVDDGGAELPAGQTGHVYFSDGPTFEYLNDPDKTASAHNAQGWATLGDIGHVDSDGYLFLSDRKSFMIISGGVNIYPQEIENLLITHDKVEDVAVFGLPDEEMGEFVMAVVQSAPGIEAGPALAAELRAWAHARLGGVKTPRQIDFCSQLPREPTGKLMKRKLRDTYLARA